jgi:hypothetical protein
MCFVATSAAPVATSQATTNSAGIMMGVACSWSSESPVTDAT